MSPEDFLAYWRQNYGDTPLVGHVLRDCFRIIAMEKSIRRR